MMRRWGMAALAAGLVLLPACAQQEEDKKITIQFNVSKEKKAAEDGAPPPQEPAKEPKKEQPVPSRQAAVEQPSSPAPPARSETRPTPQPEQARPERQATLPPADGAVLEAIRAAEKALERRDADEAIRRLSQVKTQAAGHPPAYALLARAYIMKQNQRKAMAVLQEGLARFPDEAPLLYMRGFAYHKAGHPDRAKQDLLRALEIAPDAPMALRARSALKEIEEGRPAHRPRRS
ncbi:MAG: tetratricopeptide repeat protein [Nitrospirae bacterium]|nr:tetratricopeptide repeat protein [Nitrospirota bacterium]